MQVNTDILVLGEVLRAIIQEERLLRERQGTDFLLRTCLVRGERWFFCTLRHLKFPIGLNITLIVFFESLGNPCML